jgi:hypothetical protein
LRFRSSNGFFQPKTNDDSLSLSLYFSFFLVPAVSTATTTTSQSLL